MPSKQLSLLPAAPDVATSATRTPRPTWHTVGNCSLSADGLYLYSLTRVWGPAAQEAR